MQISLIILAAIFLAIGLDLVILRWWQAHLNNRGAGISHQQQPVLVLGQYSPTLTWLNSYLQQIDWAQAENTLCGVVLLGGGLLLILVNPLRIQPDLSAELFRIQLILAGIGALLAFTGVLTLVFKKMRIIPGALNGIAGWFAVHPYQVLFLLFAGLLTASAGLKGAEHYHALNSPSLAILAWLLGMLGVIAGGITHFPYNTRINWRLLFWAGLLAGLALALRSVDTTHNPVSLTGDEGSAGLAALGILNGHTNNLFSSNWHGFPTLYFEILAVSVKIFGPTTEALRIPSAVAGALTVAAVYLAGRAMFGHRSGFVAAFFLAALHYHIHFSRVGLNNVFDGLGFMVTLGLLWYAHRTGSRGYYLFAGLTMGFTQYFYASSRALLALVALWLVLEALFDVRTFLRRLPDYLLMSLACVVVILPLGWFYARHMDEFWGLFRGQTIFGDWMVTEVRITAQPAWMIFLRQLRLGFSAFTFLHSDTWYRSGVPILRTIPAILFGAGLFFLIVRVKDSRTRLLILWIFTFGLLGATSVNTPAAQRYIAAAPACALLVGYGVVTGADWLRKTWPRFAHQVGWAVALLVFLVAADDVRFYFLEYIPNSHFRGKYDFEGYGAVIAMRLADTLQDYSDQWDVQFFNSPNVGYFSIESLPYLANWIEGMDMIHPWGSPDNPPSTRPNHLFVFLDTRQDDYAAVKAAYPNGLTFREVDAEGDFLYDVIRTPAEPGNPNPRRWKLNYPQGGWQPALIWPAGYFILAVVGIYLLQRSNLAASLFDADSLDPVYSEMETRQSAPTKKAAAVKHIPSSPPPSEIPVSMSPPPSPETPRVEQTVPTPEAVPAQVVETSSTVTLVSSSSATGDEVVKQTELELSDGMARVKIDVDIAAGSSIVITIEHKPD